MDPAEVAWISVHSLLPLPVDRATQDPQFDPQVFTADLLAVYGLGFESVTLYRVVGEPEIAPRSRLIERHYPRAESTFYYCLRVEPLAPDLWANEVPISAILAVREKLRPGVHRELPVAVTWWDLVVQG